MTLPNRRQLFLYSSLFITLAINMPKLLALRKGGIIARFWHFDIWELSFQTLMTFLYCISFFYFNKDRAAVLLEKDRRPSINQLIIFNLLLFAAFTSFCAVIQKIFFQEPLPPLGGYGLRFLVCFLLAAIELRVILLLEKSRAHEIAYEQLRSAHLQSELALLKGQLNPHFLFNSLSSLSAVVREDPRRAQQYINHLSKVFRYTLEVANTDFVSLKEELRHLRSYAELLTMRYEAGFRLSLPAEDAVTDMRIPPMSLQLLVENALKHNRASVTDPLKVDISIHPQYIEVRNNLQPLSIPEPGAGIGLSNLNQRYHILLDKDVNITRTDTEFVIQLPLP
jgi:two-component system, LytTR family, sensor kinase